MDASAEEFTKLTDAEKIAVLTKRVEALEARDKPKGLVVEGAKVTKPLPGPARNAKGEIMEVPDNPSYAERQAQKGRDRQARNDEIMRRRTEGLPQGQFRDDCGIVRDRSTGLPVLKDERENAQRVGRALGDERRALRARTR